MKNVVLWDVTPCGSCKYRYFGGINRLYHQLLVADNVSSSAILFTPMLEAIRSSETSVLTKAKRRHMPEDGILRREKNWQQKWKTWQGIHWVESWRSWLGQKQGADDLQCSIICYYTIRLSVKGTLGSQGILALGPSAGRNRAHITHSLAWW
jgi:hypothetical protein